MKAVIFLNVLWLISVQAVAQSVNLKGKVVNINTNEPVLYAAVGLINANKGVSTDETGQFELADADKGDTLVVSCVGFKRVLIPVKNVSSVIQLTPSVLELPVVTVKPRKEKKMVLHDFNKKKSAPYRSVGLNSKQFNEYAQYFGNYQESTWFLGEVKIKQLYLFPFIPKMPNTFRLRIYGVNDAGKPNDIDLIEPQLIKNDGSRYLKINIKDKNVPLPSNGLFISVEWLKTKENLYSDKYKDSDNKRKISYHYAPTLGFFEINEPKETYFTKSYNNKWIDGNNLFKSQNEYSQMAISLEIHN